MILRSRHTIAGAVCRAILRTDSDSGYLAAESAAYKCALADLGCNPLQLCADATRDYEAMLAGVNRRANGVVISPAEHERCDVSCGTDRP